jgi:hypothetical protein
VPIERVVALNPWLPANHVVRAGEQLLIPTPTR